MQLNPQELAAAIDHALLKPELTDQEIIDGCLLADQYSVATVCVRPADVALAANVLIESTVKISTIIGFPHGTTTTQTKLSETLEVIHNGASELDMVLNIGKLKSGDYDYVKNDLKAIIEPAHTNNVKVKVIFENCYLTNNEKIRAIEICNEVKADWIKTSTGFGIGGATIEDLKLMITHAGPGVEVKASGGIHNLEKAIQFYELGCTRIGTSATENIMEELKKM